MGQEEKKIDGKMVLGKEGRKEKKKGLRRDNNDEDDPIN
jgi:hypothetical protein